MPELQPRLIHESDESALTVEAGDPRAYNAALVNFVDSLAVTLSRVEFKPREADAIVEAYDAEHPELSAVPITRKTGYLYNPVTNTKTSVEQTIHPEGERYEITEDYAGDGLTRRIRQIRGKQRKLRLEATRSDGNVAVTGGNVHTAVGVEDWNKVIQGSQPVGRHEFLGTSEDMSPLDRFLNRPDPMSRWHLQRQSHLQARTEEVEGLGIHMVDPNVIQSDGTYMRREAIRTAAAVVGCIGVACAILTQVEQPDITMPAQDLPKVHTSDRVSSTELDLPGYRDDVIYYYDPEQEVDGEIAVTERRYTLPPVDIPQ